MSKNHHNIFNKRKYLYLNGLFELPVWKYGLLPPVQTYHRI